MVKLDLETLYLQIICDAHVTVANPSGQHDRQERTEWLIGIDA